MPGVCARRCSCPRCNFLSFDALTCEVTWQCAACDAYDPTSYTSGSGYYYYLTSEPLSGSTSPAHDYGSVLPRGRVASIPNSRYTLRVVAEGCKTKEYTVETNSSCTCTQSCGFGNQGGLINPGAGVDPGLVYAARDTATLMVTGCGYAEILPDLFSPTQCGGKRAAAVDLSALNHSRSWDVKVGDRGAWTTGSGPGLASFDGCKFHYIERITDDEYYVGDILTDSWWEKGTASELHAFATIAAYIRVHAVPITHPAGSTTLRAPVPAIGAAYAISWRFELSSYTDVYIPTSAYCGVGHDAADDPSRLIRAPGVDWILTPSIKGSGYDVNFLRSRTGWPSLTASEDKLYHYGWCDARTDNSGDTYERPCPMEWRMFTTTVGTVPGIPSAGSGSEIVWESLWTPV